jgi:hypothetical protein
MQNKVHEGAPRCSGRELSAAGLPRQASARTSRQHAVPKNQPREAPNRRMSKVHCRRRQSRSRNNREGPPAVKSRACRVRNQQANEMTREGVSDGHAHEIWCRRQAPTRQ